MTENANEWHNKGDAFIKSGNYTETAYLCLQSLINAMRPRLHGQEDKLSTILVERIIKAEV